MPAEGITAADSISGALMQLSKGMPVFAMVAVITSLALSPPGRRIDVIIYLLVGIGVAFVGAHIIEPIRPGGWNWQFFFYPFLFAKWFFIGFAIAWGLGALSLPRQRPLSYSLFVFALIPIVLTILNRTYVPHVSQQDRAFWKAMLSSTAPKPEEVERASDHLSSEGRESIRWHLHYHPHDISAPVLARLHALGFNALHARNTPEEIRIAAIAAAQAELANEKSLWKRSQIVRPLIPLASNPTLDDATFQLLARIGDHEVIGALIRNDGNNDSRVEWLRNSIQARLAESPPDKDTDRWYVDRLREQLDHLDRWWHFKKTGKWRS